MSAPFDPRPVPKAPSPALPHTDRGPNPFAGLPRGAEQLARVCGRGRDDKVARALCSGPRIDSLLALQATLGLRFTSSTPLVPGNPDFALLGHSTSLVGRHVSAINPRAFVVTPVAQRTDGYVVLAFTRGAAFVELAAQSTRTSRLTFYLLKFDLPCEAARGCTHADLLTAAVERDWTGVSLYDDEDLKNSVLDCLHCHQPGGPTTSPLLRMQELQSPWTHWFSKSLEGGRALIRDFQAAHPVSEDYAGIPGPLVAEAESGVAMSTLVNSQGFGMQPNEFLTSLIELEVKQSAAQQPMLNTPRGSSATWQALYAASASGRFIPTPYHDVKVTDPAKLAVATASYRDFLAGKIPPDALVDLRDVFLDEALPEMSFVPAKNASGREILMQACSQCHNSRLDQSLSRARFDVTRLDEMSPGVKALARSRILMPESDIRHMPPVMFRTLPDDARERALAALAP